MFVLELKSFKIVNKNRGVENKRSFEDSRIGQLLKLLLNLWVGKRQHSELKHISS